MQNFRRKGMQIDSSHINLKKLMEIIDNLHPFTNIFDKLREMSSIISASLNNFLQLGCQAEPLARGIGVAVGRR